MKTIEFKTTDFSKMGDNRITVPLTAILAVFESGTKVALYLIQRHGTLS